MWAAENVNDSAPDEVLGMKSTGCELAGIPIPRGLDLPGAAG